MMKLEGITAFVAVAESGSISEASRRLNLSKSVVSDRLSELERVLGTTLLHRTTRSLSLTEDGSAFLERAVRIVNEVRDATDDMAERRGDLKGALSLSAPVTFGRLHLGPALYPFLLQNPALEVSLDMDDRRVDVSSAGFDAVVRHGPIVDSRLMAWKLAPSRRLLVASTDYLKQHGTPHNAAELEGHRGIFYTNRGVADWRFVGPNGAVIVRAKVALRVNHGDMIRDAAVAGLGIALLPTFIAGPAIRDGSLTVIDVGIQAEDEFIYIAHPEGRRPSAKLRALADHLRKAFGSPPYWEP
ncbi:LysR family transcriptional regulator [Rhizobium sp. CG4]|jgi:DNA-binding transcriptional LysR family regulator|uniref:LysR family transcriptional regulator n=1 Tax=Rhizobium/Agrobacterium group TaxID=227290 RepID=UPI00203470EE|nr:MULTISPECIES: LysR family transcriptional regulator [Rhizobium/Agrobacterium group]MCM2454068.1 LysR family transcriptional regulator [Rhizobium sp. CG4]MCS4241215.1 DNA-binding transcriptional LysR family regulator [Rhizobium sp. BIGb0125]MDO5896256.1 LysR family transcriptional regulator [Agrobacterium sp. Azo12]